MRAFCLSTVPYLLWGITSVSLGAATSFTFGLKWWISTPLFIISTIAFAASEYKGWETYQIFLARKDAMLYHMVNSNNDTQQKLLEAEAVRNQIAFETSMPSVICPHCEQSKQMTYIRVPYDYDENKNVFTCPKCKNDFGVNIRIQTYQVKTEFTADAGEEISND